MRIAPAPPSPQPQPPPGTIAMHHCTVIEDFAIVGRSLVIMVDMLPNTVFDWECTVKQFC